MKLKQLIALAAIAMTAFTLQASDAKNEEIKDRIMPVGSVKVAGAVAASAAAAGPKTGKDIYNQACSACHAAGVLGAPKTQDAADWKPRLDAKGFDTVWQNAIKGINAMPPMGTCGTCTEDDIKIAIEYMIEGVE
ncbi:MAG: c-type cytochrome [Glaciecola sp.]